jgi:Rrf2 family protein
MLEVSRHGTAEAPVSMSVVAKNTSISKAYLEQLAMSLKEASLLTGRLGRKGGYVLSRPPSDIRIREIVEAAIGSVSVTECAEDPLVCIRSGECACHVVWVEISKRIRGVLDEYSLADLSDDKFSEAHRPEIEQNVIAAEHMTARTGRRRAPCLQ